MIGASQAVEAVAVRNRCEKVNRWYLACKNRGQAQDCKSAVEGTTLGY